MAKLLFTSAPDGSSLITVETAGLNGQQASDTHTHSLFVLMGSLLLQSLESTRRMMQLVEEVTTDHHSIITMIFCSCHVTLVVAQGVAALAVGPPLSWL